VLVDLTDLGIELVPWPLNTTDLINSFGFADDGTTLTVDGTLAYVDGDWTSDPTVAPPRVTFYGADTPDIQELTRVAADGSVIWRRDDLEDPSTEGFQSAVIGDIVLVRACRNNDDQPGCQFGEDGSNDFVLAALDVATGESRWELEGSHGVSIVADGYALVANEALGWHMIDLATGAMVDGQQWPSDATLGTGCCAADETEHTDRRGAAIVSVYVNTMSIYYPSAATRPTTTLTLP